MKIISAKVLDSTHLELSEPIPAEAGDLIEIAIPDDETERSWRVATRQKFLSAYDIADSVYDDL